MKLSERFTPDKETLEIYMPPSHLSTTRLPTRKDAAAPYSSPKMGVYPDDGRHPHDRLICEVF
jgi:hypothetical protein